jgi:hypothetical protein
VRHQTAFRVVNEHIDNRAALLDDQKRRPKSQVGAADPATYSDSRWRDENALMISSADRLLPTASRPDTGETPAHGKHSLKKSVMGSPPRDLVVAGHFTFAASLNYHRGDDELRLRHGRPPRLKEVSTMSRDSRQLCRETTQ